jgi:hypothetical protein
MNVIIESQYFSPVTFYKMVSNKSHVEIDQYENYQKMSFRNRCIIMGGNGPVTLSVPLEEGRQQRRPTKEVRTANKYAWQVQHWKTIVSCYNRSPWFEFYRDELENIYQKRVTFLIDWNWMCWEWMVKNLGWSITTSLSEFWQAQHDMTKWLDLRSKILPKNIMSSFSNPVIYAQVFEDRFGFVPHCSILDLLFCEGKNARTLLSLPEKSNQVG